MRPAKTNSRSEDGLATKQSPEQAARQAGRDKGRDGQKAAQRAEAQGERAAESRERILHAAMKEFSAYGLAGARTDRIAAAAAVNKALLYYYFASKEKLYEATLEMISAKIRDQSLAVMRWETTPGERLLRAALAHFDRILAQQEFQTLMQQEMIRIHKGESSAIGILVKRVFEPLQKTLLALVDEGMRTGELIAAEPLQVIFASLGANVFYFLSAPVWRLVLEFDPFAPAVLERRRRALVEFLGQAVFVDRARGAQAAAHVLADMPMPEIAPGRNFLGRKG